MKLEMLKQGEMNGGTVQPDSQKLLMDSISYSAERVIGNGAFGVVFQATVCETGETVAIKKVLQDRRFKSRELRIQRQLDHPNVVKLKHCFYSSGNPCDDEVYVNLVLEYVPETLYRFSRHYAKLNKTMPTAYIKLYMYQLLRALAYIHANNICHRDVKPQNLLLDPARHVLKLCDFGSAKTLEANEPNISYICSRYYRAPELILGATHYSTAIDMWSAGCVMAEMLIGRPLFQGDSGVDQLVGMIKVLGSPSQSELHAMNREYCDVKLPLVAPTPWQSVLSRTSDKLAIDLVAQLLVFDPVRRLSAYEALAHPYFDEVRTSDSGVLSDSVHCPTLFDFSSFEFRNAGPYCKRILPESVYRDLEKAYNLPPSTLTTPIDLHSEMVLEESRS
eukprot:CAMPEP_0185857380 /NCGR_PEP_ID=MMETSP1354-20130828/29476_1 /TAXON_ID=708628 /ORGANISM="Erythrolobus madagascarensis, Strain CCMP3276" /LENGTH=390 /DNA_ID=CAMNT_0028559651 /DNA_START=351 /DNA_END=1523 /DNA_ORIENTATION=+